MPTYVCSAATGRLTPTQKTEIVRSITAVHHEETGAPRYLVQVIFHDVAPGNHYVAGRQAPAEGPAAPPRTRFGSTCATFPQRISRSTAASCRPPGRRTHGSRRYPMPCGKGSGPWPDKLETLESIGDSRWPAFSPHPKRGDS
jgi:phenylpyruvate tautomerase PptA (4-oxalocrotonate tautomerase family)